MRKNFLSILIFCAALVMFMVNSSYAIDECYSNCGNPPLGIGGGGGGGGGSSDDFYELFLEDDIDADGIGDISDNCIYVANQDQADTDSDGVGDACDNCPSVANADQRDSDANGEGNACTNDDDGDGINDSADNCQYVFNPDQADGDGNGQGNACDGYCNLNPSQCQENYDGDNYIDAQDNCITVANKVQTDSDGDGFGNACDDDDDGDGVYDTVDNCQLVANADQADADRDGLGDSCDAEFCYFWEVTNGGLNGDRCIDPDGPFVAYIAMAPIPGEIESGDDAALSIVTSRNDVCTQITWTIVNAPQGSNLALSPYEYTACETTKLTFTDVVAILGIDKKGTWTIRMDASLVEADPLGYPTTTASDTLSFDVTDSSGGCSIAAESKPTYGLLASLLLLTGLLFFIHKKKIV